MLYFSELNSNDIFFNMSSLYWQSGSSGLINSLNAGCTRVITTQPFCAKNWFDIIAKYKCTTIFLSPAYIGLAVHSPLIQTADLATVKNFITGGSKLTEHIQTTMLKYLPNGQIQNVYGMSEMGGVITRCFNEEKIGSTGCLASDITAKLIDEDGEKVGPGQTGEVCLTSEYLFLVSVKWILSF